MPTALPEHVRLAKLGFSLAQGIIRHFDSTGRLYMTDNIRSNDKYYDDLTIHMTEIFDKYYVKTPYEFHKSKLKFKVIFFKKYVSVLINNNNFAFSLSVGRSL